MTMKELEYLKALEAEENAEDEKACGEALKSGENWCQENWCQTLNIQ